MMLLAIALLAARLAAGGEMAEPPSDPSSSACLASAELRWELARSAGLRRAEADAAYEDVLAAACAGD